MFKTRNIELFNARGVDSENMDFGVRGTLINTQAADTVFHR